MTAPGEPGFSVSADYRAFLSTARIDLSLPTFGSLSNNTRILIVFGAMTIDSGQEESRVSDLSEAGKILDIFNPTVTIKSTPLAFTAAVPY